MSSASIPLCFVLLDLFCLLIFSPTMASPAADAVVGELIRLRAQSSTGMIRLTDHLFDEITSLPTPRPFSFLVFFDVASLHKRSEIQLITLKSEFSLVSSSFLTNYQNDTESLNTLFFFDLEYEDSKHSFSLFDINSLPHIRLVLPHVTDLPSSDKMQPRDFSKLAESMSEFIESKTKLTVGPIHRPPPISSKQLAVILATLAILTPVAIKRLIKGDTFLHSYKIWMLCATFIYFFSVSGTMYTIINKAPMFMVDRNEQSKLAFFYQGSGMQLGAEGFSVGFLYTVVGVLFGFMTHGIVKVKSVMAQRLMMAVVLIISVWAVKKVVYLDNWKTGYDVRSHWPSNW
ncbi:hypothetical protein RND81_06G133100 [Saponaria officinalis]|uniref:Dolichyl-diphosphooligosaccharide--protein glycosyltransferase subunit 3B n=1 Tax=Saponaria officinalis TaxID=3572 RepID=A0AAW1KA35_SAPOF